MTGRLPTWILLAAVATCGAVGAQGPGAESSFGPRPIYLRGSALAWNLQFDDPVEAVFDRAIEAGEAVGFELVSRDDGAGTLRLRRGNEKGAVLDDLCRYPVVNYYGWRPLDTFAAAQVEAIGRRQPGETMAQVGRLDGTVHLTILSRGDGLYQVQSICSAFLYEWGRVEADSRGVAEKDFLEAFLAAMGTPFEVPLPELATLEPSRDDPKRDLFVAERCQERCIAGHRCPGMYVDPETLRLECVEEEQEKER